MIQFLYRKNDGQLAFKKVAPLQIRYYDDRYYLIACSWDEELHKPSHLLQTFVLDAIVDYEVYAAVNEDASDVDSNEMYFDYDVLLKQTQLENILKNSLGIWYDWKENKLKTFTIKFTGWGMNWIKNKKIHPSQKIVSETNAYILVKITVWDNPEIDYFLGRFGNYAELIS